jgi:peptidoglycan hydrolase CwlO-like protein
MDTKTQAIISALAAQRNDSQDTVALLNGEVASLKKEIESLKKEIEGNKDGVET